jgi:hypothetical protein
MAASVPQGEMTVPDVGKTFVTGSGARSSTDAPSR